MKWDDVATECPGDVWSETLENGEEEEEEEKEKEKEKKGEIEEEAGEGKKEKRKKEEGGKDEGGDHGKTKRLVSGMANPSDDFDQLLRLFPDLRK